MPVPPVVRMSPQFCALKARMRFLNAAELVGDDRFALDRPAVAFRGRLERRTAEIGVFARSRAIGDRDDADGDHVR